MSFTKISLSVAQGQAFERLPQMRNLVQPSPGVETRHGKNSNRCDDGSRTRYYQENSFTFSGTPGTETTVEYNVDGNVELPDQVAPARSPVPATPSPKVIEMFSLVQSDPDKSPAPATPAPKYSGYLDCLFKEGPIDCLNLHSTPGRVTITIPRAIHYSPTCDWKNPAATRSFWESVTMRIGQQSVDIYRVNKFDEGEKFRPENGVARTYDVLSESKLASVLAGDVDNDGDIDVLLKFANGAYELHRQD